MDDVVIIENLNKNFKLYHEYQDSLRKLFVSGFKKSKVDTFHALNNINLTIKKGEFFGIVGRNGSGKSTLLKIIAGIYSPDSGKVTVKGKITPFLELGVGFNHELTARENIYLNGVILGLTKKEIDKHFDQIVDFAEVREFIDMQLKKFSSGMQVRLAFAIAIHSKSEIFIIDEILAVGDMSFQQKCFDIFEKYKKEGKTIILVSHDLSSVSRFCTRAAYIKKGEMVMIGDTKEVLETYLYEDRNPEEKLEDIKEETALNTSKGQSKIQRINITSIETKDMKGNNNNRFATGDEIEIILNYENRENIAHGIFSLILFDEANNQVFSSGSQINPALELEESGSIYINLKNIPLNTGSYHISINAKGEDNEKYLSLDKAIQINIFSTNLFEGKTFIQTEWKSS